MQVRRILRWALLVAVTVAATVPLTRLGVPSAALFAALVVGIVLALAGLAPKRVPHRIGIAAQGVLGVYIGTMVHRDAVSALGSDWPIVVAIAVATLVLSVAAGALLGAAPRRQPADRVAGVGRGRRIRPGRHRPRTGRRRSRGRGRAVPARGAGHRVDAGGRGVDLSRRQEPSRRGECPNRFGALVSQHRHDRRSGRGGGRRRTVDPAARGRSARTAGVDGRCCSSAGSRSV